MATQSTKSGVMKPKSSSGYQDVPSSSSKPISGFSVNKKKVVQISSTTKQFSDTKQKSLAKPEAKGKSIFASSSKTVSKTVTKTIGKKEKKVYSLAGQKFDPPEERDPLRIFYESLSKQIPSSEMAEFWMMEHGLLSPEKARKAFDKKQRKQKQLRSGTPIKSTPPPPPHVPARIPSKSPAPPPYVPRNVTKSPAPPPYVPRNVTKSPPPYVPSKPESSRRPQQVLPKNGDVKPNKRIVNESEDDDDNFVLSHKRWKA